jgi:hypothetical protein
MSNNIPGVINSKFYKVYRAMDQAGWNGKVEESASGLPCVPVAGAPRFGGNSGGYLWPGHWTKPDGTRMLQNTNMDGSVTTIFLSPNGQVLHVIYTPTLIAAEAEIFKLNII